MQLDGLLTDTDEYLYAAARFIVCVYGVVLCWTLVAASAACIDDQAQDIGLAGR